MRPSLRRLLCVLTLALYSAIALTGCSSQPANATKTETTTAASDTSKGKPDIKVWVNTGTGVYHCPDTRWYGATKQGEYMLQVEAQDKHYRPAYDQYCN